MPTQGTELGSPGPPGPGGLPPQPPRAGLNGVGLSRAGPSRGEEPAPDAPAAPEPGQPPLWELGAECGLHTEEQLARLSAALGPLRRVQAALAERLLSTEGYARLCYARVGDYARERLGLSARQLQELARVHRALAELPAVERALVGNELPWSKVRLVARVASAQTESDWIARARELWTRRLEAAVREGGGEDPAGEEEPRTRVALRCTPAVREKWIAARELAEQVAGQRLGAAEVLECVLAEIASGLSLADSLEEGAREPASWPCDEGAASHREPAPPPRAPAEPLPREVAALAEGIDEASAFELDRRLRRALRLEHTLDASLAPLLRRVASPEYEWRGPDYWPLGSFARERLGISSGKARALVRLERAGDVCPELRAAFRSGRLSWVKAQCLLPLLLLDIDGEWRPGWVAWAQRVTLRRLERDVERALLLRAGHDRAWQRCKLHPERAQDPIPEAERQLCAPDVDLEATEELAFRVPREVAVLFRVVREALRGRLRPEGGGFLSESELFDALLDAALRAWGLRDPRRPRPDPVLERDGYRCAVPGCTGRRNLHDHHLVYRSQQGSDAAWNRLTLCAFHHQRCLHAGLLRIRGRAPGDLLFELGLRSDGPPLARYRSGDVALSGSCAPAASADGQRLECGCRAA